MGLCGFITGSALVFMTALLEGRLKWGNPLNLAGAPIPQLLCVLAAKASHLYISQKLCPSLKSSLTYKAVT